ncbi:unnamed protein product [Rhizoctonia solani]|uniref:Uncharacterized protein n=1 Tax=Rhizoctonia solani TaxID=456999 RepID=A0A8H3HHL4_9AGAM|nr:unnamed protein product [Rhizoctonia solani]
MASTSTTPLRASERTPFAALPLSRFYPASECVFPSSAKKPSFTPGSASLKRRLSPVTFASPSKKRATNDTKPSTPGEFAIPRPPTAVSKCLFEDVEMDADDSGFGASPAMKINYEPPLTASTSNAPSTSYLAPPLLMDRFPTEPSPLSTPKNRGPDAPVLAPSPEIVSGANSGRNSASRWVASKTRDPEAHHPGFDIYCDPIGYDASDPSSPMSWEDDLNVPDLVFDSPKENDAPPRKAKRMPAPLSLIKDSLASSPLNSTPKRPSRLATSTSIESPWSRMQLDDSTGANLSSSPAV